MNGSPEKTYIRNWEQLKDIGLIAPRIHAVIASHSHHDHIGNVPGVVRRGFKVRIHTTTKTGDLSSYMLEDGEHIIRRELSALNKRRLLDILDKTPPENRSRGRKDKGYDPGTEKRRRRDPVDLTLFDANDVETTIERIHKHDFNDSFKVGKGTQGTFYRAGHILGAASTLIESFFSSSQVRILNSHDLGSSSKNGYLGNPEAPNQELDIAMLETTYGDREHSDKAETLATMKSKIIETLRRGGKVIVPAFALERTQEFLLFLDEFIKEVNAATGKQIPVYTDSRLGSAITEVYRNKLKNDPYKSHFNSEPLSILKYDKFRALDFRSREAAIADPCPAIIVSSSGMCNAGAVREHLLHGVSNPRNLVLLIGYAGNGTLANALLNSSNGQEVKINGEQVPVKCEVYKADIFSAHADRRELKEYFDRLEFKGDDYSRAIVFLQHGDLAATTSFRDLLLNSDSTLRPENVIIPQVGVTYGFKLMGSNLVLEDNL